MRLTSRGIPFNPWPYERAAVSTWPIGNIIAYVNFEIYPDLDFCKHTYCVGHSLGSHICSFYTRMLQRLTDNKCEIEKILALDPAGPIWKEHSGSYQNKDTFELRYKLHHTDAKAVEVWHTNTHILGYKKPLGTVDIYINGGYIQPYRRKQKMKVILDQGSHNFPKAILPHIINMNKVDSERRCVAQWGCRRPNSISEDWKPWSLLKNIKRSEDKDKLAKAGCINEHEMNDNIDGYRLGALERSPEKDVNNFPVFWVQITPDSRTCPINVYAQSSSICD